MSEPLTLSVCTHSSCDINGSFLFGISVALPVSVGFLRCQTSMISCTVAHCLSMVSVRGGCGSSANWLLRLGNATTETAAVSIRGRVRVSCYRGWVSGESMPARRVCSLGLVCAHGARWALLWVCECGLLRMLHLGLHMAQQTASLLTSMPADAALAQMPPEKVTCPNCSHGTNRRLVPSHAESCLWCGVNIRNTFFFFFFEVDFLISLDWFDLYFSVKKSSFRDNQYIQIAANECIPILF